MACFGATGHFFNPMDHNQHLLKPDKRLSQGLSSCPFITQAQFIISIFKTSDTNIRIQNKNTLN
jgi:hypothetical protein